MKVNIFIQRLVLDGLSVPYHRQPVLQAAVETELTRLFTAGGPSNGLFAGGAVSHISGGDIQSADENNPSSLGRQIARAVYDGMKE
jgi:hypothetical protein